MPDGKGIYIVISSATKNHGAPLNAPVTPPNAMDPEDEDHVSAAEAAAAYRSHDPSEAPPPPHISLEDELPETEPSFSPPQPPPRPAEYRSAPEPQRLRLGLDKPFSDAFSVSLGWSAGRFLFRLAMLLVLFAIIALMLWNFMSQF